jgi:methylglutaconyl-CoA hydratase
MGQREVPGVGIVTDGAVLHVTLERPPGNLISMELCRAIMDLLYAPPPGVRVMHLRARGASFCLGRDRRAKDAEGLRAEAEALVGLNEALSSGELVTVSEVAGDAAGYGVGLAALCDLCFAAPSARFWFPEVEAGLAPTVVLSWLPSLVGRSHAFRLAASGTQVDGRQAADLGLVTAVAAHIDDLPLLVESEIGALLRHDAAPQREIRAFLRDTVDAGSSTLERMSVERLVSASLRLRRPGSGQLVD